MKTIKFFTMPFMLLLIGLTFTNQSFAQRSGGAALNPDIKGQNVGTIHEQYRTTVLNVWTQIGDKTWEMFQKGTQKKSNYQETSRDEWSVYLVADNGDQMQLDLWQKKVYNRTKTAEGDIVKVGLRPKKTKSVEEDKSTLPSVLANRFVRIHNHWKKGQKINIEKGSIAVSKIHDGAWSAIWQFKPVHNSPYYRIENKWYPDQRIHMENGKLECSKIHDGAWSAMWIITKVENEDLYRIQNRWVKNQRINIENGPLTSSEIHDGAWSAMWQIIPVENSSNGTDETDETNRDNNNGDTTQPKGDINFVNTASSFVVNITKIGDNDFEKVLGPGQSTKIPANEGDVFQFATNSDGFEALPYTVSSLGTTHKIVVGQRYTSGKGNKLSNAKASRHSFDLLKVDPIFIDYDKSDAIKDIKGKVVGYGGMRKQIFDELKIQDIDWHNADGDIALKNHFEYDRIFENRAQTETKMFYSSSSYEKSFSANIGADTPKGGGSASFQHTSSKSSSDMSIYTYSRTEVKGYEVKLNKENLDLSDAFKHAVKSLPKPNSSPTSLSQAKSNSAFRAYKNFIGTWGTHYPVRTTYGGVQVATYKFEGKEMAESEGWGIDVKANMKGASAGGGYSQNESFKEKQENSKGMYYSKGGTGSGDGYAVDMGNAVPINIKLNRLYELVTSQYFNDGTSENELKARRQMLRYAIQDYIGSVSDSGRSLKPRVYKIYDVKWKMINEEDGSTTPNIFGNVSINVIHKNNANGNIKYKTVFSRSSAGDSRVVAKKNYIERCPGELIFAVPPSRGSINVENYGLRLDANLKDYDKSSSDDLIGNTGKKVYFNEVGRTPKDVKLQLRSDDGDIDVTCKIKEIVLGFDD